MKISSRLVWAAALFALLAACPPDDVVAPVCDPGEARSCARSRDLGWLI